MIGELVRIGDVVITPFGVAMALAFAAACLQLARSLERAAVGTRDDANAIVLAAAVGGIVGAKIYYAILYGDLKLVLSPGGLVWYGGYLLGAVAVLWTVHRRRLPAWPAADAILPGLALGYGIGRIGCFLVGDDYGIPTGLPWGVKFPVGLPPSTAGALRSVFGVSVPAEVLDDELLAVHPTQIYEALAAVFIWRFAVRSLRRPGPEGATALSAMALLFAERFLVEFWRAKDDRFFGALSLAQLVSVLGLLLVGGLYLKRRKLNVPAGESRRRKGRTGSRGEARR